MVSLDLPSPVVDDICKALAPAHVVRVPPGREETAALATSDLEIAVVSAGFDVDTIADAPNLRWIHCNASGLEHLATPRLLGRGVQITGAAGRSAEALAEHVFFFVLALSYRAPALVELKSQRLWPAHFDYGGPSLRGQTIGLVGLGNTGEATARIAKSFGMRVLAWRRHAGETSPFVDRLYAAENNEGLAPLLRESDVIVICLPLTDQTYRLIGAPELALMKPTALLVNVARGAIIDPDALTAALHSGRIAGAGLDVTDPEPLPPGDPLWDAPNLIITPHATLRDRDRDARSARIFLENLARFRAGLPLLNALHSASFFTQPLFSGKRTLLRPAQP